jgi:hypothetical protein
MAKGTKTIGNVGVTPQLGVFIPMEVWDSLSEKLRVAISTAIEKPVQSETIEPYPVRSKEELLANLELSFKQAFNGLAGKEKLYSLEEVLEAIKD